MLEWTDHAAQRAAERFPGIDLGEIFPSATKAGKKTKAKVKATCPQAWVKHMSGAFKVRYLRVTRCGIVFVVQAPKSFDAPEIIVTVFRIGSKQTNITA